MGSRFAKFLLSLLAVLLFAYTALRAHLLSLTHDECGSFAIWTGFDIFTCRTNPDCWGTANLHWLYVLLMKPSVRLFGDSELAIRLPALLGHLVYLVFSAKLVNWVLKNLPANANNHQLPRGNHCWLALLGFVLLNCNAYLLDFHSLARGYGLAMGMMMMSLYWLARWTAGGMAGPLLGALGSAALAVLANFTLLVYFACLLAVLAGVVLWAFLTKDENRAARAKWAAAGSVAFSVVLWWLLSGPIRILRERGEFEWGPDSFVDTYKSVVACSLYGGRYLKEYNLEVFGGLMLLLLLAALVLAAGRLRSWPKAAGPRFFAVAVALPLLAALLAIAQHWLLGTKYQINRTAIMYIPLCALVVFHFFANWVTGSSRGWPAMVAVAVGLFVAGHLLRVGQLWLTSEWGYDAKTKEMMVYLGQKLPVGQRVKLGVNWLYHPSATYYQRRFGYKFAEPLLYSKELFLDGRYDYYYVQPADVPLLEPYYEVEQRFSWVGVLLRKK